ncbi:hypothetical protein GBA65_11715 [Rubrobacter marinus]|uniref:Uncharacterized protein n=1 Tax=Rubrobacter marinus TaxID=2653852 RepID=A0A6G8PY37_9ACTN|nr:hypothetical protein [Rubrobacter marinus]QIN79078.1 hypothetical protein GBA65_11715 [Rubrobacter marinus]
MIATAETDAENSPAEERPRVLVAIEPRSYRDAVGRAIQALRPNLEVEVVEPDDLMLEVLCLNPVLVICSLPRTLRPVPGRPAWFEFHPYESPAARISIDGQYFEMEEVDLLDLLSVIDDRAAAARAG